MEKTPCQIFFESVRSGKPINPRTKRPIQIGKGVYNDLVKECGDPLAESGTRPKEEKPAPFQLPTEAKPAPFQLPKAPIVIGEGKNLPPIKPIVGEKKVGFVLPAESTKPAQIVVPPRKEEVEFPPPSEITPSHKQVILPANVPEKGTLTLSQVKVPLKKGEERQYLIIRLTEPPEVYVVPQAEMTDEMMDALEIFSHMEGLVDISDEQDEMFEQLLEDLTPYMTEGEVEDINLARLYILGETLE